MVVLYQEWIFIYMHAAQFDTTFENRKVQITLFVYTSGPSSPVTCF